MTYEQLVAVVTELRGLARCRCQLISGVGSRAVLQQNSASWNHVECGSTWLNMANEIAIRCCGSEAGSLHVSVSLVSVVDVALVVLETGGIRLSKATREVQSCK